MSDFTNKNQTLGASNSKLVSPRGTSRIAPVMVRGGACLRLFRRQRLLSPHRSRPPQDHQNNRPNDTPADPCDVGVSRLPFENLLMDGHQECSGLTAALQIGPSSRLFHSGVSDKLGRIAPEAAELRIGGARKEFFLPRQSPPEGGNETVIRGRGPHHGCAHQIFKNFPGIKFLRC